MDSFSHFACIVLTGIIMSSAMEFFFSDGGFCDKKRIERRMDEILYAKRLHKVENVEFKYNGVDFTVYAEQHEGNKDYKSLELFINDESVMVVHILEDIMYNHRVVKFDARRKEKEVRKILKIASKEAEKRSLSHFMQEKATNKSYFE